MTRKKREIYLDYAAATPVDSWVFKKMRPFFGLEYGNPRSLHRKGVVASQAVAESRKRIAMSLGARQKEIIFTGSGTESNNMALFGVVRSAKEHIKKPHIIISAIEHASVKNPVEKLKEAGCDVSVVPVGKNGVVSEDAVLKEIQKNTVLISIMMVNNEIGTIQPIREIAREIKKKRSGHALYPLFHTDASQAPRFLSLNVATLGVDLLTLDASKIYGPKGVGLLYVRDGTPLEPLMYGGGQERGLRPGTENVAGIVGFAEALSLCDKERIDEVKHLARLKKELVDGITNHIPNAMIHSQPKNGVPGIVNISFPQIPGDELLIALEAEGIYVATGSACGAEKNNESFVIRALGVPKSFLGRSIRFSFGRDNTKKDITTTVRALKEVLTRRESHTKS